MFTEFANQVWTNSATGVAITNNTDFSIDGSSKKIVWTEISRIATLTFTSVTLSDWEEISLYIYFKDTLYTDLFSITVGGETFNFEKSELKRNQWNHILIDCSKMGAATTIVFTSLVSDLTLFVDYIGYRKVTYNCDMDIISALKSHINLDYDVTTTLSADAVSGDPSISFVKTGIEGYVNDNSLLQLDDGAGTIEVVSLINRDGDLATSLVNDFDSGDAVKVICPVRSEDYDDVQPDPICGIKIYDVSVDKQSTVVVTKNQSKIKEYLGALGIAIYIDCSSRKKLLQMVREYNRKYGEEFQFLLDGEQVDIYMDSSVFTEDVIGNNPRMVYYYKLEPQPYLLANTQGITTINLSTQVSAID